MTKKEFRAFLEEAVAADPEDKNDRFALSVDSNRCPLAAYYASKGYTDISVGTLLIAYVDKRGIARERQMESWETRYVRAIDNHFGGTWILPSEALQFLEEA